MGRGVKNKGEPPGPLPWIRHWGCFITGFGIVRDSLSTAYKGLTVNIFGCVSSYCLSCGNNEVNFLNLVSNALTIQPGKSMRQSFAFNARFKIPRSRSDSQTVRGSLVYLNYLAKKIWETVICV